jgi:hypothetical protein
MGSYSLRPPGEKARMHCVDVNGLLFFPMYKIRSVLLSPVPRCVVDAPGFFPGGAAGGTNPSVLTIQ